MNQQSVKVAATMLDVAKTKRLEAMQRLQKINEKQKVMGSKKMKLLEKAIPSKETTKTKAGASQSGVPRKKTKKKLSYNCTTSQCTTVVNAWYSNV